jgi:hypothetical protein
MAATHNVVGCISIVKTSRKVAGVGVVNFTWQQMMNAAVRTPYIFTDWFTERFFLWARRQEFY